MGKNYNVRENNPMWGKRLSLDAKRKLSEERIAEKNPMWKGNKVGYWALHEWVHNRMEKPSSCPRCNKVTNTLDLTNKGVYDRDLSNWEYLCRRCHMVKDGRLDRLIERNKRK